MSVGESRHGTEKIPCSIAIITSKADGLEHRLKALSEFGEIVICHGNAPEENLKIARDLGAVIVRQYDTDEPLLNSMTDKAAVRQVAMDASTLPWRFFMDRDDVLSPETIAEIRTITTDPNPEHLIWRMPSRIFIEKEDGTKHEIRYAAAYPAYQTRLVHKDVGAQFRGLVHERLSFDHTKFSVGTMRNSYNLQWSKQRVAQYWKYLSGYADMEIKVMHHGSFKNFLYWMVYRRARTIASYLLWRLPKLYLMHGFTDTMPLFIELTTVRYHFKILFGGVRHYIHTRSWYIVISETLRGKDLYRTLTNLASRRFEAYGRVLDVGGGEGSASYWRFMKQTRWKRVTTLDVAAKGSGTVVANLEDATLPFPDAHFNTVMVFNVLEHLHRRTEILLELNRVLRPDGRLVGIVPFLVNVHPDPHDYVRLTREGIERLCTDSGLRAVHIYPVGGGPIVASYYQSEFLLPRVLKLIALPVVYALDTLVCALRPNMRDRFPLAYAFSAHK